MESFDDREALLAEASFYVEQVAFTRVVGNWMPTVHVGVSDKVYLVTGGRGTLLLDGGSYDLRPGRALLIPAGARQQGFSEPADPLEKVWVHFASWTGAPLQLLRFLDPPTCLEGPPAGRMIAVGRRMLDEWNGARPGRRLALRMMLMEMLLLAYRADAAHRCGPDGPGLATAERRSNDDERLRAVRRVVAALCSRYAEPLTLGELAASVGWTPTHLSESFRRLVGLPPMRFLEGVRMRRAQELLTVSAEPVHRVAAAVGFADPNYFSRAFTRHVGMAPSAYRAAAAASQPKKVQN